MKRDYVEQLDAKAAPWAKPGELSDGERKENRVRYLMQEARQDEVQKELLKAFRRLETEALLVADLRKKIAKDAPHSAWVAGLDLEKGEAHYQILIKAPPKLVELMDADQKIFMTNIVLWESADRDERTRVCKKFGIDPCWIEVDRISPLAILPDESKAYALAWQQQINIGAAYAVSKTIGEVADSMIARGYCMASINNITHAQTEITEEAIQVGRDDLPPGNPGSKAWVRAMMGEAYVTWLTQNERDDSAG